MAVDTTKLREAADSRERSSLTGKSGTATMLREAADEIDALRDGAEFANNMLSSVARCLRVENDCDIEYEADSIRKDRDALRVERDELVRALLCVKAVNKIGHFGLEVLCGVCGRLRTYIEKHGHTTGCPVGLAERITQGGA